jgi:hypothetical protein
VSEATCSFRGRFITSYKIIRAKLAQH